MQKRTAGPWERRWTYGDEEKGAIVAGTGPYESRQVIAHLVMGPETEGNARLLAMAPELERELDRAKASLLVIHSAMVRLDLLSPDCRAQAQAARSEAQVEIAAAMKSIAHTLKLARGES